MRNPDLFSVVYLSFMAAFIAYQLFHRLKVRRLRWLYAAFSEGRQALGHDGKLYMAYLVHALSFSVLVIAGYGFCVTFLVSAVAACGPSLVSKFKEYSMAKEAKRQIEPFLISMASSLHSNPSLMIAMQDALRDLTGVFKHQIARTVTEMRMGVGIDEALMDLTKRMASDDLRMVFDGLIMCRETGADAVAVLNTLTVMMLSKQRMESKLRAQAAQQKATAVAVILIPLLFIFITAYTNPIYSAVLSTRTGFIAVVYSLVSLSAGLLFVWLLGRSDNLAAL